jgi:hypothetical protein
MLASHTNVLHKIEERLVPDTEAKEARGEVFTPLTLIYEMILGVRKSDVTKTWGMTDDFSFFSDNQNDRLGGVPLSVLRDPESTFLDPACGIGNFPIAVFSILDFTLSKKIPNEAKRHKHIVEKMLFMLELSKPNVTTAKKLFEKLVPGATPNIVAVDSLTMTDEKLKDEFKVNRFTVVMGNPPFNEGGTKTEGEKAVYKKFISYGFDLLEKNGFLVYVHPPNFHRIQKDEGITSIFTQHNLLFLRIIPDTKTYFDVQIPVDYYVLQNKANQKEGVVLDKQNVVTTKFDIGNYKVVPNFGFQIISLLMKQGGSFEAEVGRDSSLDQRRITKGSHKLIHYINKDGIRIFKSKVEHKYQHTKKAIVNGLGVPYVYMDTKGEYGVTEGPYYVLEPSKKESIFLQSKLFQLLANAFKIQGNKNDMFLFDVVPNLNTLSFTSESSLYDALHINTFQKDIDEFVIPTFEKKEKIETTKTRKNKK